MRSGFTVSAIPESMRPAVASVAVMLAVGCISEPATGDPTRPRVQATASTADPSDAGRSVSPPPGTAAAGKIAGGSSEPVTVVSVEVGPAGQIVNAPSKDGASRAGYPTETVLVAKVRLSDGSSSTVVDWASSDIVRATVDGAGRVRAVAGAQPGTVIFTATSKADPTRSGSVVVLVRTLGNVSAVAR